MAIMRQSQRAPYIFIKDQVIFFVLSFGGCYGGYLHIQLWLHQYTHVHLNNFPFVPLVQAASEVKLAGDWHKPTEPVAVVEGGDGPGSVQPPEESDSFLWFAN